jgi:hypothetical protein
LATDASIGGPFALAFDSNGNALIAALTTDAVRVRRVDHLTGDISSVMLTTTLGDYGDMGGPMHAGFAFPSALVVDDDDNLYLASGDPLGLGPPYDGVVRKVTGPL